MGFRINTNIAAMNAHRSAIGTNKGLDKSLQSLSSGLRINTAADDASGMTIADSLKSQALGLAQAINNANDGVAVVQTADGALDEYINIINTVRTKSIQAASDGQNADSRQAIQRDIDRLLESADKIANTTQFNGQKLLDGTFTNKAFHIGAYAAETVELSVGNVQTDSVGDIASVTNYNNGQAIDAALVPADNIETSASGYIIAKGEMSVNGIDITPSLNTGTPSNLISAKSLAAAITDATGLLASGKTELTSDGAVTAGSINSTDFMKINGIDIGDVTTVAGDANGALVKAINDVTNLTGVVAETNNGILKLTAEDGRNISVDFGAGGAGTETGITTDYLTDVTGTNDVANGLLAADTAVVTLTTGQLVINGTDLAGSYGDGTAGTAATALLAAVKAIDGLETSTIADGANGGLFTLRVNNGNDLNISGTAAAAYGFTLATETGIFNESKVGDVNIYSDEKVVISGNSPTTFGFIAGGYTPESNGTSLESINVLTRNSAEVAILISDSALKQLDATRSDLGSVQNQLESTIRNISVTQVNVTAAESQIRDVDFAAESANFAKLNILAQSGSYAMSQANAVQQNVLRLLQ